MSSFVPIILQKGQLILTQTEGSEAGFTFRSFPFKTGTVAFINDLSDLYSEGDVVVYNTNGATIFQCDLIDYVFLTEDKIIYKYETAAP